MSTGLCLRTRNVLISIETVEWKGFTSFHSTVSIQWTRKVEFMENEENIEQKKGTCYLVLKSLIWPISLLAWILVMVLLVWWQVPLFISLPAYLLGISVYVFMMIWYARLQNAALRNGREKKERVSSSSPQHLTVTTSDYEQLQQIQYPEQNR